MSIVRRRLQRFPKPLRVDWDDPQSFQRDGRLHALVESVHVRRRIETEVRKHLEPSLRKHLHGVSLRGNALTLSFDSAAFTARLRYRTDDLSRKLRRHPDLRQLETIRCIVRPPMSLHVSRAGRTGPTISEQTARMLQESAENFSDSEIRDSIQRLAALSANSKNA